MHTVCIPQENRFKGKLYVNFCYLPNPICEGAPEGKYPVTISKEVLYGFTFIITKKHSSRYFVLKLIGKIDRKVYTAMIKQTPA